MTIEGIQSEQARKNGLYETANRIRKMVDEQIKANPKEEPSEIETEITRLVFEDS